MANVSQMASALAPPVATRSACTIAFRMSRNEGLGGDSSMPRVTSFSVNFVPRAFRRSQRVSSQISPSACTSGSPAILPKSPYV